MPCESMSEFLWRTSETTSILHEIFHKLPQRKAGAGMGGRGTWLKRWRAWGRKGGAWRQGASTDDSSARSAARCSAPGAAEDGVPERDCFCTAAAAVLAWCATTASSCARVSRVTTAPPTCDSILGLICCSHWSSQDYTDRECSHPSVRQMVDRWIAGKEHEAMCYRCLHSRSRCLKLPTS